MALSQHAPDSSVTGSKRALDDAYACAPTEAAGEGMEAKRNRIMAELKRMRVELETAKKPAASAGPQTGEDSVSKTVFGGTC